MILHTQYGRKALRLVGRVLLISLFVCASAVPMEATAQDTYAAFVHGFTFGDDRPKGDNTVQDVLAEKGQRWDASGSIQYFQNQAKIIDGHILLKYFDRDLYGGNRDKTLDFSRTAMMQRFVSEMKNAAPNAEWILVGHSQGGIVVRLLHEYIRQNVPDLNVTTVTAIASPMQGAKPATVSYGYRAGYKNAQPTVDGFLKDVLKAPLAEAGGDIIGFFAPWAELAIDIIANFWDPADYLADGVVDLLEGRIENSLNGMAVDKQAKEAIGPGGYLIEDINAAPDPQNYRALLGAERAPTFARVASGASTESKPIVEFRPIVRFGVQQVGGIFGDNIERLTAIFTRNENVDPGDEAATLGFFYDLKDIYRDAADYYRHRCYWTLGLSCIAGDYRKHNRWKAGRRALEGFGSTYAYIIDANKQERRYGSRTVCRDPNTGEIIGRNLVDATFKPPTSDSYVHGAFELPDGDGSGRDDNDGILGNECWEESYTYYVTVPNKSDGLLGTVTTTWNGQYGDRFTYTNLGPESILYGDESSSSQYEKGGTGFNHAEMVYSNRRYSANTDPGVDNSAFYQGQLNPPIGDTEDWLRASGFQ